MGSRRSSRDKGKRRVVEEFDLTLFDSKNHAEKFLSFELRSINKGKYVDLNELRDVETIQWFANLNLLSILHINEPIYPRLVRLFYNNMQIDDEERMSTYLLGQHISITDRFICDMIGIPMKSIGLYFKGSWDEKTIETSYVEALGTILANPNIESIPKSCEHLMPFNTKILHHIMTSIILPKQYHHDEVSQLELGIMYLIMKERDICLGYLIQQNMLELSTKDMMLPYGGIITRIMKAYDIQIPLEEEVMKSDRFSIINKNLLHRLRCHYRNGNWVRMPRRTDPPQPEPEPEPEPETPVFRSTHSPPICPFEETHPVEQTHTSSIEDIGIRMDRFEQRQERLELRQDQILTELQQIHRQFDSLLRHFNLPPHE